MHVATKNPYILPLLQHTCRLLHHSSMYEERKRRVREIVKTKNVYQSYKSALSQTIRVVESSPIEQTMVLATWLFATWEGAYILANSLLRGLDLVKLPPECLMASRHRASCEQFQNVFSSSSSGVPRWTQILPSLPMSPGDEGFFLITSTLGTLLTGKANLSVRISPSWIRDAGFVCPWGATTNGHLMMPIKMMDIRAKQALAALLAGGHFTNAKESVLTRIPIADGFAWNDVIQGILSKWRALVITAFIRICLDTAEEIEGRKAAKAALVRSAQHLVGVFPDYAELLQQCWNLAAQPSDKIPSDTLLQVLEESLTRHVYE
jgi:hypothetical protein